MLKSLFRGWQTWTLYEFAIIDIAKTIIIRVEVLTAGFDEIRSVIQPHKVGQLATLIDQLILQTLEKFLLLVLDRLEST